MTHGIEQRIVRGDELNGIATVVLVIDVVDDDIGRGETGDLSRAAGGELVRNDENAVDRNTRIGREDHFRPIQGPHRCGHAFDVVELHASDEPATWTSKLDERFAVVGRRRIDEGFIDDRDLAASVRRAARIGHARTKTRRWVKRRAPIRAAVIVRCGERQRVDLRAGRSDSGEGRRGHRRRGIGMEGREVHRILQHEARHTIKRNHVAGIGQVQQRSGRTHDERGSHGDVSRIRRIHDPPHVSIRGNRHRCTHGIRRVRRGTNRQHVARRIAHDVPANVDRGTRRIVELDELGPERAELADDDVASLIRRYRRNAARQIAHVERTAERIIRHVGFTGHHVTRIDRAGNHVVDDDGRIRWDTCGANVVGALIAVDRNIAVFDRIRVHVARSVALTAAAITGHRIVHEGAIRRVVEAADTRGARTDLAGRIHSRTGARHEALYARARTVAHHAATLIACGSRRGWWIRRRACGANVVGALIAIHRQITVVDGIRRDVARSVALGGATIARDRIAHDGAIRRVDDAAGPRITRADLAGRIHPWTVAGHHALRWRDAAGVAIALRTAILIACRTERQIRMRRRSRRAGLTRALVAIIGRQVVVIVRARRDSTRAIALIGTTVTNRRIADDRTIGRVDDTAATSIACMGLTCRARTALAGHIALNALSHRVAE